MGREKWIEHLESGDPQYQFKAALFCQPDDDAYSLIPLLIAKAQAIDVDSGPIDLDHSNFVGQAAKTSARLIRKHGYSDSDKMHCRVKDWIFHLNYCSELNAAGHSVSALEELWIPPESVRDRLVELTRSDKRDDNQLEHPGTIRGLAFRALSRRDRETAKQLIHTPAREDFLNMANHTLEEYKLKYPNNEKVPKNIRTDIEWLGDAGAG